MFVYTPSPSAAYGDMQHLKTGVGFGQLIRNVHRWSAHLMVLVVVLHLVRVFYAGAYKRPRRVQLGASGVVLLLLTLGLSFTGYLLPWDQLSYWAVTVGTNLVHYVPVIGNTLQDLLIGGDQSRREHAAALLRAARGGAPRPADPGGVGTHLAGPQGRLRGTAHRRRWRSTPSASHAPALPDAPAALYGERTRVLGVVDRESVTAEDRGVDDTVFTWPHLVARHVVVALGVFTVVLAMGVAFVAPLRGLANPNLTPEPSKAPWYFSALQELLSHFDPLVAGILVPGAIVLVLVLLPYIDRNPATEARNRKVAVLVFSGLLLVAMVLTVIGTFFRGPGWHFVAPWDHLYLEL